jgi:hypothetical protein
MTRRRTSKQRETLAFFVSISGHGEYKHLNLRIRKMTVISAERALGDCVANYPENTQHYVDKARKVYESTGDFDYLDSGFSDDEIELIWQSDKSSDYTNWYGPRIEMRGADAAINMLKRVHKLIGGWMGFSTDPRDVVKALQEKGHAVAYHYLTEANEHVIDKNFDVTKAIPSPPPAPEQPAEPAVEQPTETSAA